MNTEQMETRYLGRNKPGKFEMLQAEGLYLTATNGKKYIDFTSGYCVGNLGWNNRMLNEAIKTYQGPNYVSPHFYYKRWAELAEMLAEITPGKLKKTYRATGGTEAVEIALQAAIAHTKRNKFIAVEDAYHGDSIAAKSLTSAKFGETKHSFLNVHRIKPPLDKKAAEQIKKWLEKKDVAALIMEPIIMNLAVEVPEQEFMQEIARACKKNGTLLIMDEVMSGFGRTGKLFATEYFDIEPDIMCLAKSLTGGAAGIGATIVTEEVSRSMEKDSGYYSTYGWHPLSVEAAIANVAFYIEHEESLMRNVDMMSDYFYDRLFEMPFKSEVEIRIAGLAVALSFKDEKYAGEIEKNAFKNGLLVAGGEGKIKLFPALIIDKAMAKKGLDLLEKSL
jgi:acetylornithine/succinyldiaminopimelate/putrescine aminotransferase